MSTKATTKTATVKTETKTATASKATPAKTTKPATKPAAKATTAKAKTEKAPVAKKERKSRKGITRSFAAEVTAAVNPVMNTVNAFISNPETSEDALKMIRLELRKAVRATRGTIRTRKASTTK
jgi:DNA-binding protein HU-beta